MKLSLCHYLGRCAVFSALTLVACGDDGASTPEGSTGETPAGTTSADSPPGEGPTGQAPTGEDPPGQTSTGETPPATGETPPATGGTSSSSSGTGADDTTTGGADSSSSGAGSSSSGAISFYSCQLANAIPGDGAELAVEFTFPESGASVTDLNLEIEAEHEAIGELQFELEHDGTTVVLFDQACADADNIHVTFTDLGAEAFDCADTVEQVDVLPANPLAPFETHNVAGTWTLRVTDLVDNAVAGTLETACLGL